jgi:ornithine carbamoyltransferase
MLSEDSMASNLRGRHFLTLLDYSGDEILDLLRLSADLKAEKASGVHPRRLLGKSIAVIFEKPSARTRSATVVAAVDEGAHPEYLGREDIRLGVKESVADLARVVGRMFDGIMYRGFSQKTAEELAEWAGIPVWNALTDLYHPTQALADFLTVQEAFGSVDGAPFTYVGDGRNNVANSLLIGAAKTGLDFRIAAPRALFPADHLVARARELAASSGAKITITDSWREGVADTGVVYTDVWASMGEEDRISERIALLREYRVTSEMLESSGRPDVIFLHCLPCFHDDQTEMARDYPETCEATNEVFEGEHSRVFDQAENRLHTIKAIMVASLVGSADPVVATGDGGSSH